MQAVKALMSMQYQSLHIMHVVLPDILSTFCHFAQYARVAWGALHTFANMVHVSQLLVKLL